ncbi:amino acid permease [Candidatus Leptofilum sp.]|uniref:amino acid permease n=1 Tax=Candidatus Leptofilum sp. TaxID=3241576 RepID=UPI003B596789
MTVKNNHNTAQAGRFGTFTGVFTPNILTILGIILFLRVGWVVGQAGLWGALAIVVLANLISFLTGLSLSAIATSMDVRAGGNYYLISRSLGLEVGGAIGIPLYLSQAISIAFYIIGFTEALLAIEFFQGIDPRLIATAVALLFAVIAYIGADFALRIQFFILAVLVIALISFFAGGWDSFGTINFSANYTIGNSFWTVFAVFFPAVTGIEVGISLSGDLKDPSKSIPRGTIASIAVTAVVYILAVIWFATHLTADELINNNLAMQSVAFVPGLILAGVWASTLSSALGSVLAAPRTLQAIAQDRVLPVWMAGKMGSQTEPRVAVLISAIIAVIVIWLGDLDFVAPIISMFFLNTYGMVNLVASIENLVGNPSYRPQFKIPWFISMLGAIGCYGAMFLISPVATIIAIVITYGVFFALEQRQVRHTWGDVQIGIWIAIARYALLQMEKERPTPKNWRPNLIVFTGQPHNREQLVAVADWLSRGRGIVTFFQLIIGDVEKLVGKNLRETARRQIRNYIQDHRMTAFAEAEVVSDFKQGVLTLAQAHGIGNLTSNSILMGWSRTEAGRITQMELMRQLVAVRKSVLFLNYDDARGYGQKRVINIWWQGRGGNADLKLLLAYLIQRHGDWFKAEIRLIRIIDGEEGVTQTEAHLEQMLDDVRVEAEPVVIVREDPQQSIANLIEANSYNADLTILGMKVPSLEETAEYSQRLNELVKAVGTVLLVRNAELGKDLLTTGGE